MVRNINNYYFRYHCCALLGLLALLFAVGGCDAEAASQIPPPNDEGKDDDEPSRGLLNNKNNNEQRSSSRITDGLADESSVINMTQQQSLTDPDVEQIWSQYWKETFADIRKMASGSSNNNNNYSESRRGGGGGSFLSQWKLLTHPEEGAAPTPKINDANVGIPTNTSASTTKTNDAVDDSTREEQSSSAANARQQKQDWLPPRFEGFPSWERMLLDWSDEIQDYLDQASEDIQEYLDQASEDSEAGYLFANYGRPATNRTAAATSTPEPPLVVAVKSNNTAVAELASEVEGQLDAFVDDAVIEKGPIVGGVTSKRPMPIPAPAKLGEEMLPHTDISDKSKRILIVTTAALPWKTGTAVNPLLRAAYLTKGRKEAGGSVTLMLPWLERKDDQIRVYGAATVFATPADQDEYIRTWLRESADMKAASEELNIEWYTAWQNKVENSIYSMGDITAVVSADQVDICILEEPEHLNWYRAPGESWTKKFKHVVGILHTNYFSYALDQPAALIRVSEQSCNMATCLLCRLLTLFVVLPLRLDPTYRTRRVM